MGGPGSGRPRPPCGTTRGYHYHHRHKETPCQACKDAHAAEKRERYKPRAKARKRTSRDRKALNRQIILQAKLNAGACMDCGFVFDRITYVCADLDHRQPKLKSFTISQRKSSVSTADLRAEIAKCDVVCANCHRLRTYVQLKTGVVSPYNYPRMVDAQLVLFELNKP